ncbi:efflux RND transporter periplasmic adaptor subunit [Massilia arenosa]|uniref:Efflux RND transporter periplasmic adaptor subunit n=1 Tax=Zemynaea arenosa TaxID=2561931 RepID=A0A4Y9STJ5_9BURK|nr:efflux RND transporter periplasmic adaptor subunit [Massilia arenosa]TFW28076.1 efflux RND transporter periplasmic adaptor subunit [Massilia arenosa]
MLRKTLLLLAIASALAACGKGGDQAKPGASATAQAGKADKDNAPTRLSVAPEDLVTVTSAGLASGPVITGSVEPERKADLRAEVSAVVLKVLKENGDVVKKGDVLVVLDETSIRDAMSSADEAVRAAQQSLDQSQRNLERTKTLRGSGMISQQALDDAEVKRNNAQSDLAAARSRAASARQQMVRTVVRAPFDGIVSERKVSAGDTAAIGKELVKVIDPTSMRFEGKVSADKISAVKTGEPVLFRINGYGDQEFRGVVKRVDPSANAITRQVEVLVAFTKDSPQPRVSGLYGEGTILSDSKAALMLPESTLVKAGDVTYAWRVKNGTLNKATLKIGSRDERTGQFEIASGLTQGDLVMRNPGSSMRDGQKVDMAQPKVASAASTSSTAVQGK